MVPVDKLLRSIKRPTFRVFVAFTIVCYVFAYNISPVSGQNLVTIDDGTYIVGEDTVPGNVLHMDESVYFSARCLLFIDWRAQRGRRKDSSQTSVESRRKSHSF